MNTAVCLARIAPSLALPQEHTFMVHVMVAILPPFSDHRTIEQSSGRRTLPILLSNRCSTSGNDQSHDSN